MRSSPKNLIILFLFTLFLLTSCSGRLNDDLVDPVEGGVSPVERDSVFVMRDDLTPEYEAELVFSGYDEIVYRITEEENERIKNEFDAKMEQVKYEVGDKVKEGDVLISFSSKKLDEKLEESKNESAIAGLSVEHFNNLLMIDPKGDYLIDLKKQMNSKYLADLYIKDIKNTYQTINKKAVSDGMITYIDPAAKDGNPAVGKPLIKVVSGDGYYVISKDSVSENSVSANTVKRPDFKVGSRYKVRSGLNEYEVSVIYSEGDDIRFEVLDSDGIFAGQVLRMDHQMETLKDVCFVDHRAVIEGQDGSYVFLVNEDGSRRAVKVRTGVRVGDDVIIEEGLFGGEEVSLP